jgi:hypothetical protein
MIGLTTWGGGLAVHPISNPRTPTISDPVFIFFSYSFAPNVSGEATGYRRLTADVEALYFMC